MPNQHVGDVSDVSQLVGEILHSINGQVGSMGISKCILSKCYIGYYVK